MEKKRITLNEELKKELVHFPSSHEDRPYLIGSRCKICNRVFFPKKDICLVCMKEGVTEDIPLSRRGKIYSYFCSDTAPLGFTPPHLGAFIDLPEGVRVFSLITAVEPKEEALEIGDEVELVIEKIGENEAGDEIIGYKFKPIGEDK